MAGVRLFLPLDCMSAVAFPSPSGADEPHRSLGRRSRYGLLSKVAFFAGALLLPLRRDGRCLFKVSHSSGFCPKGWIALPRSELQSAAGAFVPLGPEPPFFGLLVSVR